MSSSHESFTDILVHYGEIALKGKNRPRFVGRLEGNLRRAFADLPLGTIKKPSGRLWLTAREGAHFDSRALERLSRIFGVTTYAPVRRVPLDLERMKSEALRLVSGRTYESFRVRARRAFKELPYGSQMVNEELGAYLLRHRPARVQMKGADLELHVEMVPDAAYLYVDRLRGPGGLPVGIGGRAVALLSGGIDSPVAAWRTMRRGLELTLVHFHAHPIQSRASLEKAEELAAHLAPYQGRIRLHLVPIGELQREVMLEAPASLRVVLYRRFMLRLAESIAKEAGAEGLVTGESLGQVASQTLTNMGTIGTAVGLPILRPLVAFDKQEIVDAAKTLGTFEISIQPDEDCCSLFVPRHPETRARLADVVRVEDRLDVRGLCEDALGRREQRLFRAPWWRSNRAERREEETL